MFVCVGGCRVFSSFSLYSSNYRHPLHCIGLNLFSFFVVVDVDVDDDVLLFYGGDGYIINMFFFFFFWFMFCSCVHHTIFTNIPRNYLNSSSSFLFSPQFIFSIFYILYCLLVVFFCFFFVFFSVFFSFSCIPSSLTSHISSLHYYVDWKLLSFFL
ncbi:hypothetical protein Tb927.2.2320 [Trypanosoma brucei brucei TREU927]|uniref:Uncharacterized protein n=1 Tax=Trypanosoma brucei brucei (strain 927/4 GUTat10.1) TaxID=185431 RepID=Q586K7_TRYB2|nr:hypothetical protein Tb927.2.2320 [Trypanosoma brucei brucei TREU927]AAQ15689.1 hypothetical protein Tb927.2.2320 [Trypanosoma brucei brucei TREU927]AAX79164.1 hypothetical protein Tb927.2.2320 [Trypanosoma brucei]